MPPFANLLFHRSVTLFSSASLLIVGTLLYAFSIFDLFSMLMALSVALTWLVLYPASRRAWARQEFVSEGLERRLGPDGRQKAGKSVEGLSEADYTKLWAVRLRHRARKELGLEKTAFDVVVAVVVTGIWVALTLYLAAAGIVA